MQEPQIIEIINEIVNRMLVDKGESPHRIDSQTVILGGDLPIDSLDLAAIVVELESRIGRDPFANGFIQFNTAGELSRLYKAMFS